MVSVRDKERYLRCFHERSARSDGKQVIKNKQQNVFWTYELLFWDKCIILEASSGYQLVFSTSVYNIYIQQHEL